MKYFDILIIGNGILAYLSAYAIMKEDPYVTIGVVGPSSRLWGATPASGAMLGCFGEVTSSSLKSPAGQAKFAMTRASTELWPSWLEGINQRVEVAKRTMITPGTFVILNAKSGLIEDENYSAIEDTLQAYEQRYQVIDPREIRGLDPIEDCRPLRAMYLNDEGSINSVQVLDNLQSILEQSSGVSIIEGIAKKISTSKNEHSVELETGEIFSACQILLAAGTKSQDLIAGLPMAQKIPPIFAGVGFSAVVEKPLHNIHSVIRTPNRSFSCGLHIVPRGENHLYIGATNNAARYPVSRPNMGDIHFLLECALEQIHQGFEKSEVVSYSVGNRPLTIDTYPLIGMTSIEGLFMLTGTYREGFHLSPLLAQHIAKQMLGKGALFDNIFQPERSPISTMTKQEAIEYTVKHLMAVGYEFSIRMPQTGWQDMFRDMLFAKVTRLYEDLESDHYILPPNFVTMIEADRETFIPYFRDYYKSLDTYALATLS